MAQLEIVAKKQNWLPVFSRFSDIVVPLCCIAYHTLVSLVLHLK